MTSPIAFAKLCVDRLVKMFPNVKCRYEYHSDSYTHFIEVVPNSVFKFDDDYIRIEEQIALEFEKLFPTEFICFITDDSVYKITEPLYTQKGFYYSQTSFKIFGEVWELFADVLTTGFSSELNEAVNHDSVSMKPNNEGCNVKLLEPPPKLTSPELKNLETQYITESFFVI